MSEWVSEVTQSCPTLCNPMGRSLKGSSVHEIFQARVLEWVAISFSRGSSQPRDRTQVSCIAGRCFTVWATMRQIDSLIYFLLFFFFLLALIDRLLLVHLEFIFVSLMRWKWNNLSLPHVELSSSVIIVLPL